MNLSEFMDLYPEHSHLESSRDIPITRYSNGLEEGSEHESIWFCDVCEEEYDGDTFDPCDICEENELRSDIK